MGYIFHAWKKVLKDTPILLTMTTLQGEIANTCLYDDLFTRNVFMFKNVYLLCLYMNGIVLDPVLWDRLWDGEGGSFWEIYLLGSEEERAGQREKIAVVTEASWEL